MSFSYSASSLSGGADQYSSFAALSGASAVRVNSIASDLLTMLGGSSSVAVVNSFSGGEFLSQIEQSILRADNPIEVSETEELTVLGQRGLWVNKQEVNAWRGDISISEYRIHEDSNPQVYMFYVDIKL